MSAGLEKTLDEVLRRLEAGESLQTCLTKYSPAVADELRGLVELRQALKDMLPVSPPSPAARADNRARYLAQVQAMHAERRRPTPAPEPSWLERLGLLRPRWREAMLAASLTLVLGLGLLWASFQGAERLEGLQALPMPPAATQVAQAPFRPTETLAPPTPMARATTPAPAGTPQGTLSAALITATPTPMPRPTQTPISAWEPTETATPRPQPTRTPQPPATALPTSTHLPVHTPTPTRTPIAPTPTWTPQVWPTPTEAWERATATPTRVPTEVPPTAAPTQVTPGEPAPTLELTAVPWVPPTATPPR